MTQCYNCGTKIKQLEFRKNEGEDGIQYFKCLHCLSKYKLVKLSNGNYFDSEIPAGRSNYDKKLK